MALERIPPTSERLVVSPYVKSEVIKAIQDTVSIRLWLNAGSAISQRLRYWKLMGVDFIDETKFLTQPADEENHIWKHDFKSRSYVVCRDLGEALRRIGEGAR
jgi:pyridoxal 5'-phosphate synthase pdxS subunit